jgi:hypothetical protein
MPRDESHPIVPGKRCEKCNAEPVRLTMETPYVNYYGCATCLHIWAEPRPSDAPPVIW